LFSCRHVFQGLEVNHPYHPAEGLAVSQQGWIWVGETSKADPSTELAIAVQVVAVQEVGILAESVTVLIDHFLPLLIEIEPPGSREVVQRVMAHLDPQGVHLKEVTRAMLNFGPRHNTILLREEPHNI
jgi:hypothetical protein